MANMSMGDRGGLERAAQGNEALLRTCGAGEWAARLYVALGLAVLGALSYAAIDAIHGWDHIVVIADIVLLTVAVAFFLHRRPAPAEIAGGSS